MSGGSAKWALQLPSYTRWTRYCGNYADCRTRLAHTAAAFAAALKPPFLVGEAGSPGAFERLSKDAKKAKKAADATAMAALEEEDREEWLLVKEMMNSKKIKKMSGYNFGSTLEEAVAAYETLAKEITEKPFCRVPDAKTRKNWARDFILMARRKANYNTTDEAKTKYKKWGAVAEEREVKAWSEQLEEDMALLQGPSAFW